MTTAASSAGERLDVGSATRTLRTLLACALGALPLVELFTDRMWLVTVWLTMGVVLAPAALLRLWWHPRALHTWIGLLLLVPWLTARFAPHHAVGGVLPGAGTWRDVSALFDDLHRTTSEGVAPIHTTDAVVFTLCLVLGLLTALIDLLAVVGRHGALAGVPLLVVFTVAGAVPRHPVHWLLFIGAAIGFLLLLSLDARDEIRGWGRLMPRPGEVRPAAGLAISGQRIAVVAVAAAVLIPLLTPSRPGNLVADAFHSNGGGGNGKGTPGFGAGGVSIDPFAALKGQLNRPKPIKLFTVTLDPTSATEAFYLRTNVLSTVTAKGWVPGDHGATEPVGTTTYPVSPDSQVFGGTDTFSATIQISGLGGNAPVFDRPAYTSGLPGSTQWSPQDQLLLGGTVHKGDTFQESVIQPHPTTEQLDAAPEPTTDLGQFLAVPGQMRASVQQLVGRITRDKTSPYGRARAISDYFTDPANGFTYSLQTTSGDSGSALVDFLKNKSGFCQQFAAAMGIMLRTAGVPARVVLGYTHAQPDKSGAFTVTTDDAHAWVEAYFDGLGWVPFDPTPNGGVFGGSKASLPWAPHPRATQTQQPTGATGATGSSTGKRAGQQTQEGAVPTTSPGAHSTDLAPLVWAFAIIAGAALVALLPALARWRRRRTRLRAARSGDPDPLWAELSATAVDLGYVWSPARTPRQVATWLTRQTGAGDAPVRALAAAVERSRYAPPGDCGDSGDSGHTAAGAAAVLVDDLRQVEAQLRAQRRRSVRVRARLFPESLGWRLPTALVRARKHR